MGANEIELSDLQRLARSDSPDLASTLLAFLAQGDPEPEAAPPPGAITLQQFLDEVSPRGGLRYVDPARTAKVTALWKTFLAQTDPPPPPRFALAELLVETYARGSDPGRAAVIALVKQVDTLVFGLWGGIKRIYKLAEARMDAEVIGVIAWRVDRDFIARGRAEVSKATLNYLRRRAWRFLRLLGQQTPLLYPQFAAQVLRHYQRWEQYPRLWISNHVFLHESGKYSASGFTLRKLPDDLTKHRAFDDAWRRSPDPLMTLLECCEGDPAARFAIQGLRRDFPEKLRSASPAWLARLALRPLESAHEFVVETLQGSAEFHQSKLKALGLHDAVLALLRSPAKKARAYAIEYARANLSDLSADFLLDLLADPDGTLEDDTRKFVLTTLKSLSPKDLGLVRLGRMLAIYEVNEWAAKQLDEVLDPTAVPLSFVTDMLFADYQEREWALEHLKKKRKGEADAAYWRSVLDDPRAERADQALYDIGQAVSKTDTAKLGAAWLLDAIARPWLTDHAAEWLTKAKELPGLDVERVKALVFNNRVRHAMLTVLGNTKLVRPRDIGLGWLLALARRADPSLHGFAHRYLLEHMKPADFADDGERDPKAAGTARLFALATGAKEPEPVRVFAQTYLRCHHPGIGPSQDESKAYQLKPALSRDAYTAARVWDALWDPRPDVRRFAVAVARAELRAWGAHTRVYELAESAAREVRAIAYDALLKAGEQGADSAHTLAPEELDAARVFALTESRTKSTRECGMEVIRRHYARIGGAERLAWLMQSPDREVRLFAVRLLWERHRPRDLPWGWTPKGQKVFGDTERFADVTALRDFLRRVLFSLAPGRVERREGEAASRHVPASVAKRNVIEVVRDLGVEDSAFAQVVAPVLGEFTGSLARGEWEACLAALMRMRAAHPGASLGGLP